MSFEKKTNLSSRTTRRRIQEEVKNNFIITSDTSSLLDIIPELNSNFNISQIGDPLPELSADYLNVNNVDPINYNNSNSNLQLDFNLSSSSIFESNGDCSSNESCTDYDELSNFKLLIRKWAVEFNIPLIALNSLLCILKSHKCFNSLPKDSRTLMHTIPAIDHSRLHIVEPGTYYHFGITNGILQNIQKSPSDSGLIDIIVGVDGLPLFKSSPKQFWPILAYLRPDSDKVFPIGIYCGQEKPGNSNIFLNKFIEEAKALVENGLNIDNTFYKVSFNTFVCDVPAKSFLLNIKGHSGFYSCTRCEQDGEYRLNRVCFPYITPPNRPPKRTHDNYVNFLMRNIMWVIFQCYILFLI
ncbi:unnamed protein product [Macrosiphum euphorbiae]|uniref:Transposase n=1 Tax=Macrosiphum euphorbiae TaxID=13131 RepID=A0AAV0XR59_9HEMI|nr:unnamed protein product [Macrosiphum euphorbiae]